MRRRMRVRPQDSLDVRSESTFANAVTVKVILVLLNVREELCEPQQVSVAGMGDPEMQVRGANSL